MSIEKKVMRKNVEIHIRVTESTRYTVRSVRNRINRIPFIHRKFIVLISVRNYVLTCTV
jgi:hypothetical protein